MSCGLWFLNGCINKYRERPKISRSKKQLGHDVFVQREMEF